MGVVEEPEPKAGLSFNSTMSLNLVVQVAFWIVAGMITYSAVVARVAVTETQVTNIERRLDRIEIKLDQALERERK